MPHPLFLNSLLNRELTNHYYHLPQSLKALRYIEPFFFLCGLLVWHTQDDEGSFHLFISRLFNLGPLPSLLLVWFCFTWGNLRNVFGLPNCCFSMVTMMSNIYHSFSLCQLENSRVLVCTVWVFLQMMKARLSSLVLSLQIFFCCREDGHAIVSFLPSVSLHGLD